MMPADLVAFVASFGALVPWVFVLACFLAADIPMRVWGLAFAVFLSYPADILGSHLGAAGITNQWIPALLAPLQLGIMLSVLTADRGWKWMVGLGLTAGLGIASLWGAPPSAAAIVGGVAVSIAATPYKARRAIWLYCLGVLPGLIFLEVVAPHDVRWLWVWAATQGVRWAAIGWLAWEVSRGSRYRQIALTDPRGGRPHRVARLPGVFAAHLESDRHRG